MRFPKEYPYKPPSILMFTKNGRFKTNVRLCLSMSDFHPETWNPMWSVSSILSGLLSFMLDSAPTLGSMETSDAQRRSLAAKSLEENVRNKDFCTLFPEYVEMYKKKKNGSRKATIDGGARAPGARASAKDATTPPAAPGSINTAVDAATDGTPANVAANAQAKQATKSMSTFSWSLSAVVVLVIAASLYWVWGEDNLKLY